MFSNFLHSKKYISVHLPCFKYFSPDRPRNQQVFNSINRTFYNCMEWKNCLNDFYIWYLKMLPSYHVNVKTQLNVLFGLRQINME